MALPRRVAGPNAKNRTVFLDAAEKLMIDEGYAAVTSRRVAAAAGLKPQLVHYYFRTMDDLFMEVVRRRAEEAAERQAEALASDTPIHSLWALNTDPRGMALITEFAALANHRKEIRAELARYAEQYRAQQAEAFAAALARRGKDADAPPIVLAVVLNSIAQILVMEQALGMSAGHAETLQLVEQYLGQLEHVR